MGLGTALVRGFQASGNFMDERLWQEGWGMAAMSGFTINEHSSLANSPVWACVTAIADPVATVPILTYRRRPDGGKERAFDHPLYDILHDQPNRLQTAFTFKRVLMTHALLWGNGYAQIMPGPRGAVDQLLPLHPDGVRTEMRRDGTLLYHVRQRDGTEQPLLEDQVFHVPGLTLDGLNGLSLMTYARESIGLALSTQTYSAKFFGQGARPSGFLKVKGKLTEDAKKRLAAQIMAVHGGVANMHKIAVLEEDSSWESTGLTNEDAQLLGLIEWNVADLARWFRVPLHMIGETSKVTSWGTGIEQLSIGFVVYSLLPWLENWQQTIRKDLIVAKQAYFAEFLVDALLRGDIKTRYEAYQIGRLNGWLSPNDIRGMENMNPIPNGDGYLQPLNYVPLGTQPAPALPPGGQAALPAPNRDAEALAFHLFARDAAARVVRKEQAAVRRSISRAPDEEALTVALRDFYDEHADFMVSVLRVPLDAALDYCTAQIAVLTADALISETFWDAAEDRLVALVRQHAPAAAEERSQAA